MVHCITKNTKNKIHNNNLKNIAINYYLKMNNITIKRTSNVVLMARNFKILVDGVLVDKIGDGETKTIILPPNSSKLTVKIMNYETRPKKVCNDNSYKFTIKQNIISTITTIGMMFFALIYFITKYIMEQEQKIFLFIAVPFFFGQIYYSTFGRKDVVQMVDSKD